MLTHCQHCCKTFEAREADIKRNRAKFCSIACGNKSRVKSHDPNEICASCHLPIYVQDSRRRGSKSGLYFCSRTCKDFAQRIGGIAEIQPDHYGTGYLAKAWNNFPHKCNRCGYDELPAILDVHHKDHDHQNNSLANLELLCPNCHAIEHRILHPRHGDKIQGESSTLAKSSWSVRF